MPIFRLSASTSLLALFSLATATFTSVPAAAADPVLHEFQRQQLTDVYFSEGANAGDLNHDGKPDVVHGPYWFAGPDFKTRRELYPPKPQNREAYSDNFFSWVCDFNNDGWNDVLVVGFPGTPAYVYENPRDAETTKHWTKHQIFDWVSNESPQFTDITGDGRPELVCTRDGRFGYAVPNWDKPFTAWTFHAVSGQVATPRFGHGLGVGDVDGDKRLDLLAQDGWFQQPESTAGDPLWKFHKVDFAPVGGADMFAYDIDGDGDNDVITSLAAHDFGLAWFEQLREGNQIRFRRRLIMGRKAEENRYGVLFTELHSVALVDMNGDGLKDIVTGKTYWSHHRQSPLWDAGAVVYWFQLVRNKDGVDWVPHRADGEAGIGRQLVVTDLNGDKLPDVVVGGMKGAHVLLHATKSVTSEQWQAAQPKPIDHYREPELWLSPIAPPVAADTGRVAGAIEGESLKVLKQTGRAAPQDMKPFGGGGWSGAGQLFWTGAQPKDRLELEVPVAQAGDFQMEVVLTKAPDYAVVQLALDGKPLGAAIDLYDPAVVSSGVLTLGARRLEAGPHTLSVEIVGANARAAKAYMFGLDYIALRPQAKP